MTTQRLWLIGGTQESAELALAIATEGIPCLITVTTEAARRLYPASPQCKIWVGRLDQQRLPAFLQQQQITAILDASHPFAVEVSRLAIAIAAQQGIPYLRYERPALDMPNSQSSVLASSFQSLLSSNLLDSQRVLLTVGYRPLPLFKPWQEVATLFTRILPSLTALETAITAGFTPDRIIALRPPISAAIERALWQQWQISMVVTKASGAAGGEDVKRQVADELGVKLVAIARPKIIYPQQTSELAIALQFCRNAGARS
ncbi:MAG: cobalt-precorrin-6A reductase [Oscillatoriales cyanobacterium C42_A2020_001]|nr:cobalt-precorrin-6A reductase [Leptolyngbyaceae cyanobacterium C42_A2020_001]